MYIVTHCKDRITPADGSRFTMAPASAGQVEIRMDGSRVLGVYQTYAHAEEAMDLLTRAVARGGEYFLMPIDEEVAPFTDLDWTPTQDGEHLLIVPQDRSGAQVLEDMNRVFTRPAADGVEVCIHGRAGDGVMGKYSTQEYADRVVEEIHKAGGVYRMPTDFAIRMDIMF